MPALKYRYEYRIAEKLGITARAVMLCKKELFEFRALKLSTVDELTNLIIKKYGKEIEEEKKLIPMTRLVSIVGKHKSQITYFLNTVKKQPSRIGKFVYPKQRLFTVAEAIQIKDEMWRYTLQRAVSEIKVKKEVIGILRKDGDVDIYVIHGEDVRFKGTTTTQECAKYNVSF